MQTLELVIFDCDGVLVDSEPITNALLQEDLAARGLALGLDDVMQHFVGGTMASVGAEAARMGAEIPDNWVDLIYAEMHRRLERGTPIVEGVEAVLDALDAAGIPYAVGSNGSMAKMRITLGQHPALETRLKGRLYSAHVLGKAKPDPALYLQPARDLGVDPDRTAVIEDSPTGCIAARRAGMTCFGYAPHDDGARLAAKGARVFHDMRELPRLLNL